MLAPSILASVPVDAVGLDRAVLRTVAYSDVFDFPLRDVEVHRYLHGARAPLADTIAALGRGCTSQGALTRRDGYYTLRGREGLVETRRERGVEAARRWPAAVRFGRAIGALPFVRMVAVTGSLAWDNSEPSGDIDYMIVTDPGRLWVCRWLVGLLVRAARFEGAPRLCPNYLVSTRALLLADHNLYAAYELARATPIVGRGMFRRLRRANAWATAYLPNAVDPLHPPDIHSRHDRDIGHRMAARLKRFGERVLATRAAAAWERYEMQYRISKRLKQYGAPEETSYGRDWYKAHSNGHRQRTLAAFTERLRQIEGEGI